jgi:hypothetical protein
MSSREFTHIACGTTAKRAFNAAVKQALYNYGHNGYTGTIAEKSEEGFIMFPLPKKNKNEKNQEVNRLIRAKDYANTLMGTDPNAESSCYRISSKYDPAGCIEITKGKTYLFFGFAQT